MSTVSPTSSKSDPPEMSDGPDQQTHPSPTDTTTAKTQEQQPVISQSNANLAYMTIINDSLSFFGVSIQDKTNFVNFLIEQSIDSKLLNDRTELNLLFLSYLLTTYGKTRYAIVEIKHSLNSNEFINFNIVLTTIHAAHCITTQDEAATLLKSLGFKEGHPEFKKLCNYLIDNAFYTSDEPTNKKLFSKLAHAY